MSIPLMNGLSAVLAGVCAISYIYFGLYIIYFALKDKLYRPLLFLCVFSSVWSFTYVMYFLSGDPQSREIWQRCGYAGMLLFVFSFWFILRYTGFVKNKKAVAFLLFAIWLPPLVSVYKNISENAVVRDFPFGFWYLYTMIQPTVYNCISIILLFICFHRLKTNKGRRQKYILCASPLVFIAVSWAADYFFAFQDSQNVNPFWLLLWIGVLLYTIKKYRFIPISPDFIISDITGNIEEGIILLDPELKIIFTNRAAQRILNIEETVSGGLSDFVSEKHILDNELSELTRTDAVSFRLRINFIQRETNLKIPIDLKVKKVIDTYNDISGFLIIVSRVKDIEHLKTLYKITGREMEVINQLAVGKTNKEISDFLEISERTIDAHVANIYNKLLVKSRIELVNILSEFNLQNYNERIAFGRR